MKLTFLGTGTSTGIPVLCCTCATCTSTDPRDKRQRSSVIIYPYKNAPGILIDAGPDLRNQLLTENSPALAGLLITHIHYDHVGGMDDLRPYCKIAPDGKFPVYCRPDVAKQLHRSIPYAFASDHYPGAPVYDMHELVSDEPFTVELGKGKAVEVIPLPVLHGKLPIFGYRIGSMAYITDCSFMPKDTLRRLYGVETLIINALRPKPHMSHFNLEEALAVIAKVNPKRAFLTHICHDMPPQGQIEFSLPPNVRFATDGETIEV